METTTTVAIEMIRCSGVTPDSGDSLILESEPGALSADQAARCEEITMAALKGFFQAAAEGHSFVPFSTVENRFGRTLEQNYPEAGFAFLKFARSYWSLKHVVDESLADPSGNVGEIALAQIERIIGPLFFPFPGPHVIDPAMRERDQRKMLVELGGGIDAEDFIRNNPILIRDRASQ